MTPTIDAPTRTSQTSGAVSASVEVLEWVHEAAAWLTPREVVWCDGSPAEAQQLTATLVESGTFTPLNPEKRPGSYLARSEPSDVARV
ncbi:MAG: phosphoenolpyruvate carboxykinase, partial [Microbacteriaceae bacterium]|nr:phosphoenolpyruvate carboxykinase [Microbacteriaceae bacterium]